MTLDQLATSPDAIGEGAARPSKRWGPLRMLMFAKWRSVANGLGRVDGGFRGRAIALFLLGAVFWGGTFIGSHWFLDQCQRVELFGDVLVEQLMAMVLLIVFAVLLFSNLVSSFSTYYLADDLRYLMAEPLPPYSFFSARFIELCLQSSWMVALFSLPVFISVGIVYEVDLGYYVRLPMVMVPLLVIATALATIVSLVLTNLLPARRTREVILLLVAVLFVTLFIVFRSLEPERFLNPDERAGIVEVLSSFKAPRLTSLPPEWVHQLLWPFVSGEGRQAGFFMACLYTSAAGLFFVSAWLFRALHFDGYSKSREGRSEGSAPERLLRGLWGRRRVAAERGRAALARLARRAAPLRFRSEMRRKDARTFIRDTAQWTQLVLLAALVVIYLLNFRYIQKIGEGGFIGPTGLYFSNLGLSGFVVTAIAVRFVFPAVSLEGRSFWLIRSAPVRPIAFLRSKWWALVPGIWLFGQLLTFASNLMIGVGATLCLVALVVQTAATLGVVALGVGLGAMYPKFRVDNAAQIATGFGGFVYMVTGVGLNLVVVLLSVLPSLTLKSTLESGALPYSEELVLAGTLGLATLLLPLFVGGLALRVGARRLEKGG